MIMLEIVALENGAHRNQTFSGFLPDGWALVPDGIEMPDTFPFVNIEVANDDEGRAVVVCMTAGVVPEPDPEPDPEPEDEADAEPSAADDTAAMLIDHEYRLTLLELGLSE